MGIGMKHWERRRAFCHSSGDTFPFSVISLSFYSRSAIRDTIFLLLALEELFCLSAWLRDEAFWEGLAQFLSDDLVDLLYIGEINCTRCSIIKLLRPHRQSTKNVGIRVRPYLSLSFAIEDRSVLVRQRSSTLLSRDRQLHPP